MTSYKILTADSAGQLEEQVQREICAGMDPVGGVSVSHGTNEYRELIQTWSQAMVNTKLVLSIRSKINA